MRATLGKSWPTGAKHREVGILKWWSAHLEYAASLCFRNAGLRNEPICWLSRNRRMSKDDERKVQTSETLIEVAMIRLLVARLGRCSATQNCRSPSKD